MKKSDSEQPIVPPVDFDPPSNGEFCPLPPSELGTRRHELWRGLVEEKHRRLGLSRRAFAESACGTAAWLYTLSQVPACGGESGGYTVSPDAMEDMARAREMLAHDPFVFDVQTHTPDVEIRPWPEKDPPQVVLDFLKIVFVQSNTTVACLSGVPDARSIGIPNVQAKAYLQELIDRVAGPRIIFHCNAEPAREGEPDFMSQAVEMYKNVGAWKTYPQGPNHGLDHPDSAPFLERAQSLGVRVVASHRGISQNGDYLSPGSPLDVVRAAKAFPEIKFLVYHSGWEFNFDENHPYTDLGDQTQGVDRFIKALQAHEIGPGGNVYAELGTTWFNLIGNSEQAGHVLGKLLAQLGPDRIVWGTDTVFNGIGQPQIDAFWMYEIPAPIAPLYPALGTEVKRKILGLNGAAVYGVDPTATRYALANDDIEKLRLAYRDDPASVPMPHPRQYVGPRTRREFLAFVRRQPGTV